MSRYIRNHQSCRRSRSRSYDVHRRISRRDHPSHECLSLNSKGSIESAMFDLPPIKLGSFQDHHPVNCDFCGKVCNNLDGKYQHQFDNHLSKKIYDCAKCPRRYRQLADLRHHMQRDHNSEYLSLSKLKNRYREEFDGQVRTKHKYIQTIRRKLRERNERRESRMRRPDVDVRGSLSLRRTSRRLLRREHDALRRNVSKSGECARRDLKKLEVPQDETRQLVPFVHNRSLTKNKSGHKFAMQDEVCLHCTQLKVWINEPDGTNGRHCCINAKCIKNDNGSLSLAQLVKADNWKKQRSMAELYGQARFGRRPFEDPCPGPMFSHPIDLDKWVEEREQYDEIQRLKSQIRLLELNKLRDIKAKLEAEQKATEAPVIVAPALKSLDIHSRVTKQQQSSKNSILDLTQIEPVPEVVEKKIDLKQICKEQKSSDRKRYVMYESRSPEEAGRRRGRSSPQKLHPEKVPQTQPDLRPSTVFQIPSSHKRKAWAEKKSEHHIIAQPIQCLRQESKPDLKIPAPTEIFQRVEKPSEIQVEKKINLVKQSEQDEMDAKMEDEVEVQEDQGQKVISIGGKRRNRQNPKLMPFNTSPRVTRAQKKRQMTASMNAAATDKATTTGDDPNRLRNIIKTQTEAGNPEEPRSEDTSVSQGQQDTQQTQTRSKILQINKSSHKTTKRYEVVNSDGQKNTISFDESDEHLLYSVFESHKNLI